MSADLMAFMAFLLVFVFMVREHRFGGRSRNDDNDQIQVWNQTPYYWYRYYWLNIPDVRDGPRDDRRGPRDDRRGPHDDRRGPRDDRRGPHDDRRGPRDDPRDDRPDSRDDRPDSRDDRRGGCENTVPPSSRSGLIEPVPQHNVVIPAIVAPIANAPAPVIERSATA